MQIDKQQIIDVIRNRGEGAHALLAESELPLRIDTEEHAEVLRKYDVDPQDLGGDGLTGLLR